MARSCSTSASASGTVSGNGEPRPADDLEKRQRTQPGVVSLAHLLQGPDAAPPEYLTLSLTPAGEVQRREQPGEVTLKHIDAPRDYLKLSLTPPDEDEPGPNATGVSSGGNGSVVEEDGSAASSGVAETALVIVDAVAPPAATANNVLPPKKRKFAACFYQEKPGTSAPASSSSPSRSLSLAMVVRGSDGETRSPAAMDGQPIDAVPLQAVCARGRVWRPLGLSGGAGEIPTKDAASTSSSTTTAAPFSTDPISAVPLRAAWCPYAPLAAGAASGHHPGPPESSWTRIRAELGLQPGHPLHLIAHKRVERSDLDLQQSRLLIPRGEAARLIPLLSDNGRRAANLEGPWKRPKRQTPGSNSESSDDKKARAQGKRHGGLVVPVYLNRGGDRMDAQLTRWTSNGNTVLKFGSHKSFVDVSGLQVMDEIQIWAFQNPGVCLVITKIGGGGDTTSAARGGQQSKPPSIV